MKIAPRKLKSRERNRLTARLIGNTLRRKRPDNILKIANIILTLEYDMGGLQTVSETVGVSKGMLRKFLAVYELTREVKNLVRERKIDSVEKVYLMKKFGERDQLAIANGIIQGRLPVDDMRIIVPHSRVVKGKSIDFVIKDIMSSKDIKTYIILMSGLPKTHGEKLIKIMRKAICRIISPEEIVRLSIEKDGVILEITREGLSGLRKAAKDANATLRGFLTKLFKGSIKKG